MYRQVIGSDRKNFHALHYLGMIEAGCGNYEEAKTLLRRSLSIEPPNVQFIENYATVLFQTADYNSALEIARRGLRLNQSDVQLLYISAISSFKMSRLAELMDYFDKLLVRAPNHAVALNERGAVQAAMKDYDAALASFAKAIALESKYAEAHLNAGNVFGALKKNDEALTAYDRALALRPELADAWMGRGNVLVELKQYDGACVAYDKALALKPDLLGAWLGRGGVYVRTGQYDIALAVYNQALALKPDCAEAWLGCGNAYTELKQFERASSAFDKALTLQPDLANAWLGRGNVFAAQVHYDASLAAYDKAIVLKPDLAEAWLGRGVGYAALTRYDEAFAAYDQAFALKPDLDYASGARLFMKHYLCNWTNRTTETAQLMIGEGRLASMPFDLFAMTSSAAAQLQCARLQVQKQARSEPLWRGEVYAHDRIRLAYLSADFREHAVAYLMAGLFEHHDRSRFEVTALSLGPDRASPMRERIKGAVEHFVDAGEQSDQDIAELIRRHEIDVVIDLMGLTKHNRFDVLARRPAPIQVNYLGYSGTTGADFIDYILADATVIPEEHRAFYSEEVVWLPDSYLITDDRRVIAERTPSRSECGLPEDGFVFCCFNNTYKLGPETFQVWMRLLKATPAACCG